MKNKKLSETEKHEQIGKHEELLRYKNLEKQNFFISKICNSIHDQKTYGKFNKKKKKTVIRISD